jgi:ATP-dependent Clp protease ATP-binding subunit ClpA
VIQQRIENPLAGHLLSGEYLDGDTILIDVDPAKRAFTFGKRTAAVAAGELVGGAV